MAGPNKRARSKTVRPKFNVFSLLDLMLGRYVKGRGGLYYVNGGYAHIMGFAGRGNTFKSALSGTMATTMSLRYGFEYTEFYDTEMSMQPTRIQDYINSVAASHHWGEVPKIEDLMENELNTWNFTASDEQTGDQWWNEHCRAEKDDRRKIRENKLRETVFVNIDGTPVRIPNPWSFTVDSLSELHTNSVEQKFEKATIGEKELNTEAMDDARSKAQLIKQMPNVAAQGGFYFGLIAHADDELKMDQYAPSTKKLDGLKGNLKLKGVPGRGFTFLTNSCLLAIAIDNGLNKSDKMAEYHHPDVAPTVGDTDLRIVKYMELRGKSGPTGACIDLVFSQREGFLPNLTEYNYLGVQLKGWGMESSGSGGAFKALDIYPDVKFTRKNIRQIIRDDPKFCRALSITAALAYTYYNYFDIEPSLKLETPDLVKAVTEAGFDWDKILSNSVDYWFFEDQRADIGKQTLTARTIMGMASGEFTKDHALLKEFAA